MVPNPKSNMKMCVTGIRLFLFLFVHLVGLINVYKVYFKKLLIERLSEICQTNALVIYLGYINQC